MERIICSGTFDKLHTGHVKYFEEAKDLAENPYLIVIVAKDNNSERIKKKKTINNEKTRLKRVKELGIADKVVFGYEQERMIDRIVDLKPDIIALGHDQWAKEEWLKKKLRKRNIEPKIVRMPKFDKKYLDQKR